MKDFWDALVGQVGVDYFTELNKTSVYNEVIDAMGEGKSALEFGAGVGRNLDSILQTFSHVTAYDIPNVVDLIDNFDGLFNKSRCTYTSDWESIRTKKFDSILALSVLDHIEEEYLVPYLEDISKMSNRFVVHGRRLMDDDNKDILTILERYFIIEILTTNADLNNNEQFIAVLKPKE
jgi:2-polyprenyl-3-methyl-5-hydroxy-6-metoxy-1,4-benzoquinol methylase